MTENLARDEMGELLEEVSSYFFLLSEPMRLKILYALCGCERAVADLVTQIESTQANVSRHLNLLYRARILARRKEGTQVYYRIDDRNTLKLCRTVCTEVYAELERRKAQAPGAAREQEDN